LLRRIEAALAPATITTPPQEDNGEIASVQPVSLTTGADIATSAVVKTPDPTLKPDTIGGSAVNLRSGPSSSSPQLSVLQPGEAVQTGQTSGGWIQVTRADGSTGWIYASYLSSNAAIQTKRTTQAPTVASNQPRAVIKGDDGDLEDRTARIASRLPAYDQPGGSDPVMTFSPGTRVRIAEVRGNWLRVETGDGTSAWIRR
jgi:SH3-like domain-containing protein